MLKGAALLTVNYFDAVFVPWQSPGEGDSPSLASSSLPEATVFAQLSFHLERLP